MVCIAAFIILCLVSVFVAFLSIFRRDIGKRYLKMFKKAWACVGRRLTLQKCETGFADEIKYSILKKVVLKKPHLVRPISIAIEAASVLIVVITVWSLVEGAKAGLSLWTLGTCNVQRPAACAFGAEICSIDGNAGPKNPIEFVYSWLDDWRQIFTAIPDKFRDFSPQNFHFNGLKLHPEDPTAVDIFDPGCVVCAQSYKNQLRDGFFTREKVLLVPFPIKNNAQSYKFKHSELIVRLLFALSLYGESKTAPFPAASFLGSEEPLPDFAKNSTPLHILHRIFTGQDQSHRAFQDLFANLYDQTQASNTLKAWLKEFHFSDQEIDALLVLSQSEAVTKLLAENQTLVVDNLHAKGIPTMLYQNHKHTGIYEEEK